MFPLLLSFAEEGKDPESTRILKGQVDIRHPFVYICQEKRDIAISRMF
jgi:hypothetical protein